MAAVITYGNPGVAAELGDQLATILLGIVIGGTVILLDVAAGWLAMRWHTRRRRPS